MASLKKEIYTPHHYAKHKIEPITFILANNLSFAEGNVIKYIMRYKYKNGITDLEKAKCYVEMLIEEQKKKKG